MTINKLKIPETEDTKELADMAVEQFARFFWEYWVWMKGVEEQQSKAETPKCLHKNKN